MSAGQAEWTLLGAGAPRARLWRPAVPRKQLLGPWARTHLLHVQSGKAGGRAAAFDGTRAAGGPSPCPVSGKGGAALFSR